jgi:hypothetical protein
MVILQLATLVVQIVLIVLVVVLLLVVEVQTMILKKHVIAVVMVIDVPGYIYAMKLAIQKMNFNV